MPIYADFHSHSSFSSDSQTPLRDMVLQAVKKGLTHYCVTEHFDPDYPVHPEDGLDFQLDTEAYLKEIMSLRKEFSQQLQLSIGIELGLQPHLAKQLTSYLQQYSFDFVIGSSHLCHGKDPYYPSFYEGRSEEEAYREYFSSIHENILSFDNFDVYGHLDYVVRYGPNRDSFYSYEKYSDILDSILHLLIQKGKGIEVNTGGLKYGLKELHPCLHLLKRYKELGGEILTIGSDAHKPEAVAAHFSRAEEALRECGFRYYTIFIERTPRFLRL